MRRPFAVAAATAALAFAVLRAEPPDRPAPVPVSLPDWLETGNGVSPPPHWIPKQPGHYYLTDWRRVIDSTWGPGLPVDEKLAIFDLFWDTVDAKFACFNNLDVNWDSLRSVYRTEVEDTVSQGRFAAIMNHMAMALREMHTYIIDNLVNAGTELLPGVPLWVIGARSDVGHFGAALSPLPDSSLLVYQVAENHPLGLERGDVVLGYDRRPWTEILRELKEAELPVYGSHSRGSCSTAMTYYLLNAAGMNWHLLDTIDIVKYATDDTVHLPTALLAGDSMELFATDQLDIPGVPKPEPYPGVAATYGIVSGTRVGYIYCWRWLNNADPEFRDAVDALVSDTTVEGIIIDFRYNLGGDANACFSGLRLLFRDSTETHCWSSRSDPGDHFAMRLVGPPETIPGNGVGYDKPIAMLTGPWAVSAGDQSAFRMTFHPRVRTFGKSTNTAFNGPWRLNVPDGWDAKYAQGEMCLAFDTTYFLTHREFPVDVPVWHTRDAVARGEDKVVNAAIAWIDSVTGGAVAETRKCEVRAMNVPTIVHRVLFLPRDMTGLPGNQDRVPRPQLLDVAGRKALDLKPGPNDVGQLGPGVYFVRQASGVRREASSVTKVVLAK